MPTYPEAPLMRTFCPLWISPFRKKNRVVFAPKGMKAASSKAKLSGFNATAPSLISHGRSGNF